jgi:hypothetical protein
LADEASRKRNNDLARADVRLGALLGSIFLLVGLASYGMAIELVLAAPLVLTFTYLISRNSFPGFPPFKSRNRTWAFLMLLFTTMIVASGLF